MTGRTGPSPAATTSGRYLVELHPVLLALVGDEPGSR
jgi:hypothetical protein